MTQSISKPVFDFSDDEKIAKALNEAPAVKAIKAKQGLVPAPKAAKTSPAKKSGRVVGISAAENELLRNLLSKVAEDPNYATISAIEAFAKLQGRYNK